MLDATTRIKYMQALGCNSVLEFQKKYMLNFDGKQWDGKYGSKTDMALQNEYMIKDVKWLSHNEIICHCGGKYCTGHPTYLSYDLVNKLAKVRAKYGAITFTCMMRCPTHNTKVGGVSGSRHKTGKACDMKTAQSKANRQELIKYWLSIGGRYGYSDKNAMGTSTHLDVL